jgi:hypothetical protein
MKKNLFLSCLLFLSMHALYAQQPKLNTIGSNGDCPAGMCPSVYFELDIFNFHKPKTNCTNGFGLCIRINTGVECRSCFGKSSMSGTKIKVWAKLNNQSVTLHIPRAIQIQKRFESVSFSQFEIEDQTLNFTFTNGSKRSARGGIYPVSIVGEEFVIQIPLM